VKLRQCLQTESDSGRVSSVTCCLCSLRILISVLLGYGFDVLYQIWEQPSHGDFSGVFVERKERPDITRERRQTDGNNFSHNSVIYVCLTSTIESVKLHQFQFQGSTVSESINGIQKVFSSFWGTRRAAGELSTDDMVFLPWECRDRKVSRRLPHFWILAIPSTSCYLQLMQGRAIALAVSRWLPTAAARARFRVWSSGICGLRKSCVMIARRERSPTVDSFIQFSVLIEPKRINFRFRG
jgi:hypothetical protein